jgi:hypothetical protein
MGIGVILRSEKRRLLHISPREEMLMYAFIAAVIVVGIGAGIWLNDKV